MNPLLPQRAGCFGSSCDVLLEQVTNAETSQPAALTVYEQRSIFVS
jgi:hypothetical protein